eukprot:scaffold73_cov252-Pinguiococcus_pyrenoidosus.AAC.33
MPLQPAGGGGRWPGLLEPVTPRKGGPSCRLRREGNAPRGSCAASADQVRPPGARRPLLAGGEPRGPRGAAAAGRQTHAVPVLPGRVREQRGVPGLGLSAAVSGDPGSLADQWGRPAAHGGTQGDYVAHVGELFGDTLSLEHAPWGRTSGAAFQVRPPRGGIKLELGSRHRRDLQVELLKRFHCLAKVPLRYSWPHTRVRIAEVVTSTVLRRNTR